MIKQSALFLTLLSSLYSTPQWYEEQKYQTHSQIYYGYGRGDSKQEAVQNALLEISQQIKISISATLDLKEQEIDGKFKERFTNKIRTHSSILLKEAKTVKSEKEKNSFYILKKYAYTTPLWFETRLVEAPPFSKIGFGYDVKQNIAIENAKKDLESQGIVISKIVTPLKSEKVGENYFIAISSQQIPTLKCINTQNSFLSKSSYIQSINKLVNCKYDYKLNYLNNSWHLQYKIIDEIISTKDFNSFFINVKNKNLTLKSTKYFLREGEGFSFSVKSNINSYISILNIYDDGKVGIVLNNKSMKQNKTIIYPSKESGQEFIAMLNHPNIPTKDIYIAFASKDKIDLSMFEEQIDSIVSDSEYRFNDILTLIQKYDYTTVVINTKP